MPVPWKCLLGIDRSVAPLMPVTAMSGLECPFALHQKLLHDLKNEALLWMCLHQYQKMDKNSFLSVFMICSPEALAVLTECLRNRLYYTTTNIILHKHVLQRIMWIFKSCVNTQSLRALVRGAPLTGPNLCKLLKKSICLNRNFVFKKQIFFGVLQIGQKQIC